MKEEAEKQKFTFEFKDEDDKITTQLLSKDENEIKQKMDYGNEQLKKLKENRSKLASNANLTAAEEPDEQADFIQ